MKKEHSKDNGSLLPENIAKDKQETDPPQENRYVFDVIKGRFSCPGETNPWIVIVILVLLMLFLWAIIHELKEVGIVAWMINKVGGLKLSGMPGILKSRSP